jgi:hypothetical protein
MSTMPTGPPPLSARELLLPKEMGITPAGTGTAAGMGTASRTRTASRTGLAMGSGMASGSGTVPSSTLGRLPDAGPARRKPFQISMDDLLLVVAHAKDGYRADRKNGDPIIPSKWDIPDDQMSRRMAILADAARIGNRTHDHVASVVDLVHGYFERAMLPKMQDAEDFKDLQAADVEALDMLEDLIEDVEEGTV